MDIQTKRFYISQFSQLGATQGISVYRLDGEPLYWEELVNLQALVGAYVERLVLPEEVTPTTADSNKIK